MSSTNDVGSSKMLVFKSSDGKTFEVNESAASLSQTIKHMIEDECANTMIPIPNVTGDILAMVIEFCTHHAEDDADKEELETFDTEFMKVEQHILYDLIMAANYLEIPELLDLTTQTLVDMIKGKTPEEIRKMFNIKSDFTTEEEEEIRKENNLLLA